MRQFIARRLDGELADPGAAFSFGQSKNKDVDIEFHGYDTQYWKNMQNHLHFASSEGAEAFFQSIPTITRKQLQSHGYPAFAGEPHTPTAEAVEQAGADDQGGEKDEEAMEVNACRTREFAEVEKETEEVEDAVEGETEEGEEPAGQQTNGTGAAGATAAAPAGAEVAGAEAAGGKKRFKTVKEMTADTIKKGVDPKDAAHLYHKAMERLVYENFLRMGRPLPPKSTLLKAAEKAEPASDEDEGFLAQLRRNLFGGTDSESAREGGNTPEAELTPEGLPKEEVLESLVPPDDRDHGEDPPMPLPLFAKDEFAHRAHTVNYGAGPPGEVPFAYLHLRRRHSDFAANVVERLRRAEQKFMDPGMKAELSLGDITGKMRSKMEEKAEEFRNSKVLTKDGLQEQLVKTATNAKDKANKAAVGSLDALETSLEEDEKNTQRASDLPQLDTDKLNAVDHEVQEIDPNSVKPKDLAAEEGGPNTMDVPHASDLPAEHDGEQPELEKSQVEEQEPGKRWLPLLFAHTTEEDYLAAVNQVAEEVGVTCRARTSKNLLLQHAMQNAGGGMAVEAPKECRPVIGQCEGIADPQACADAKVCRLQFNRCQPANVEVATAHEVAKCGAHKKRDTCSESEGCAWKHFQCRSSHLNARKLMREAWNRQSPWSHAGCQMATNQGQCDELGSFCQFAPAKTCRRTAGAKGVKPDRCRLAVEGTAENVQAGCEHAGPADVCEVVPALLTTRITKARHLPPLPGSPETLLDAQHRQEDANSFVAVSQEQGAFEWPVLRELAVVPKEVMIQVKEAIAKLPDVFGPKITAMIDADKKDIAESTDAMHEEEPSEDLSAKLEKEPSGTVSKSGRGSPPPGWECPHKKVIKHSHTITIGGTENNAGAAAAGAAVGGAAAAAGTAAAGGAAAGGAAAGGAAAGATTTSVAEDVKALAKQEADNVVEQAELENLAQDRSLALMSEFEPAVQKDVEDGATARCPLGNKLVKTRSGDTENDMAFYRDMRQNAVSDGFLDRILKTFAVVKKDMAAKDDNPMCSNKDAEAQKQVEGDSTAAAKSSEPNATEATSLLETGQGPAEPSGGEEGAAAATGEDPANKPVEEPASKFSDTECSCKSGFGGIAHTKKVMQENQAWFIQHYVKDKKNQASEMLNSQELYGSAANSMQALLYRAMIALARFIVRANKVQRETLDTLSNFWGNMSAVAFLFVLTRMGSNSEEVLSSWFSTPATDVVGDTRKNPDYDNFRSSKKNFGSVWNLPKFDHCQLLRPEQCENVEPCVKVPIDESDDVPPPKPRTEDPLTGEKSENFVCMNREDAASQTVPRLSRKQKRNAVSAHDSLGDRFLGLTKTNGRTPDWAFDWDFEKPVNPTLVMPPVVKNAKLVDVKSFANRNNANTFFDNAVYRYRM
ncbi:unnamed protein product [Amoebophrya sp. A120]|nr:unnamed protein product [Amoebophrya sp. A120]|eukprot:GSA120T00004981001.1